MNSYQVFHSSCAEFRKRIHLILVRPEVSENVGAAARAVANMGIFGEFRIVGTPAIIDDRCRALAKHARPVLEQIKFYSSLKDALEFGTETLSLASTARIGSPNRPHPLRVREAVPNALKKLVFSEVQDVVFVFGPEGDGLLNAEVDLCDWVVTIPSLPGYRSLNLSQAILVFCYEANLCLLEDWKEFRNQKPGQRDKLVEHFLQLAESSGFILPDDPFKMRPRLEQILSQLPRSIRDVKTLHGLLDQAIRSLKAGKIDLKGRYRNYVKELHERVK